MRRILSSTRAHLKVMQQEEYSCTTTVKQPAQNEREAFSGTFVSGSPKNTRPDCIIILANISADKVWRYASRCSPAIIRELRGRWNETEDDLERGGN